MANELLSRLQLKHDSLAAWNSSTIVLKPGEAAVAYVDVATKDAKGNIIHVPTALLKVGENVANSTKTFKDLPFVSALAADVYAWAKKEGIEVIDEGTGEVVSDITWDTAKNALVISRIDVVTPADLNTTLTSYYKKTEVDNLFKNYYTKTEVDTKITEINGTNEDLAEQVEELNTAVTTTLPGQIEAVDAKFANYTTTTALNTELGKKANATDVYTKAEADTQFTTSAEVLTTVNTALANVSGTDTITNITTLVEYVNEHGADTAALVSEVYGSAATTGTSRIDTLESKVDVTKVSTAIATAKQEAIDAAASADKDTTYTFAEGTTNGAFSVTPKGGSVASVKVHGLGTAAYTASTAYATAAQGKLADTALQAADLDDYAKAADLTDTLTGTPGAGKTVTAFDQVNGKVTATFGNISVTASQVSDFDAKVKDTKVNAAVAADKATADASGNTITTTYATKAEVAALTTDDIGAGSEVWIINCGTSTTVI